jgi:hypothetical protein
LRHLGALSDSKLYDVSLTIKPFGDLRLPTTRIEQIKAAVSSRAEILRRLGYDLSDQDLWDGWLILEESSAERIIGKHLIRWFAPKLATVRTVAANGINDVGRTYLNLHKLMLFTYLEPRYRGRVAVITDGGTNGQEIVAKLRGKYAEVPPETFDTFAEQDFERYYPAQFSEAADSALAQHGQAKRSAKKALLDDVLAWIDMNEDDAREAFMASAADVIGKLRRFEQAFQ